MNQGKLSGCKKAEIFLLCFLSMASYSHPLAVNSCEELEQLKERQEKMETIPEVHFQSAVGFSFWFLSKQFFTFEGRFPNSLKELCESPYVPVDCKEYKFPSETLEGIRQFISFPFLFFEELKPGEQGHCEMFTRPSSKHPDATELVVVADGPVCEGGKIVVKRQEAIVISALNWPTGTYPYYLPGIPEPLKRAYAVQEALRQAIMDFEDIFREKPLRSVEKFLELYPFSQKLKNDYTGGYAHLVQSPSPGDFRIILPEKHGVRTRVEVYSDRGIPVDKDLSENWVNKPPNTPKIEGPASGAVLEKLNFSCTATDRDNDWLIYQFHFGDSSKDVDSVDFESPEVASGTPFTTTHAFSSPGTYRVYCRAVESRLRDRRFMPSFWSRSLKVEIKQLVPGGLAFP